MSFTFTNDIKNFTAADADKLMENFTDLLTLFNTTGLDATYFPKLRQHGTITIGNRYSQAGALFEFFWWWTYAPCDMTIDKIVVLTTGVVSATEYSIVNVRMAGQLRAICDMREATSWNGDLMRMEASINNPVFNSGEPMTLYITNVTAGTRFLPIVTLHYTMEPQEA